MKIFRWIIWALFFSILIFTVQESGIEGDSHLLEWGTTSIVSALFIYWLLRLIDHFVSRFSKDGIKSSGVSLSESLKNYDPIIKNIYRVLVLLILALGIDKIDKFTWDIARDGVNVARETNEKLDSIEDEIQEIKLVVESNG